MATNGESARRWLEENQDKVSLERIRQIRDSISSKLQDLNESDETYPGLLEALDVMDNHLLQEDQEPPTPESEPVSLDLGPLVSHADAEAPQLTAQEKKLKFQQLLKTGKL
ncbi:hypothetical protein [Endozoicomonas numazuensis]|uniref:Uncharacterized protein n=1 Tax=Endozoicomonas numazuensis TaxID=1137799 RepID=A0A081NJQ0_9GAMM|nr:hypothetical protein [Endozoicomonas numazuensis]KEQ18673.1 hypothetical protein GZ78_00665 [Endozoicomonas numazuensis]